MKTVVITGASDGLGQALVKAFSQSHKVIALARNKEALNKLAGETGCDWHFCDVKDARQVSEVFKQIDEKHDSIDVLINNAGVIVNGPLTETTDEDIENVISTNTLGAIYVAKAAFSAMKQQQKGLIINVVSQAGLNARANRSIYNASKWGMTGFTKALQEEAAEYGVRVTGFYPGTIRTNLFAKAGLQIKGPAIEVEQAVAAVRFVVESDDSVLIPELDIKPAGVMK